MPTPTNAIAKTSRTRRGRRDMDLPLDYARDGRTLARRGAGMSRVAIVTGGASGIGAATVDRLRAQDIDVAVFDLVGDHPVDVSDPTSVAPRRRGRSPKPWSRRHPRERGRHSRGRTHRPRAVRRTMGTRPRGEPERGDVHGPRMPRRPRRQRAWTDRERRLDRSFGRATTHLALHRVQARTARFHALARRRARPARRHCKLRVPGCHPHRYDPRNTRSRPRHLRRGDTSPSAATAPPKRSRT